MCSGFHQVVAANLQKYLKYCALSSKKVSVKLHQREFESLFPAPSFLLYSGAGIPILSPARSFPSSRAFLLFPVRISFLPHARLSKQRNPAFTASASPDGSHEEASPCRRRGIAI
jgi:hypothetical protein